jgi:hypothetical protein
MSRTSLQLSNGRELNTELGILASFKGLEVQGTELSGRARQCNLATQPTHISSYLESPCTSRHYVFEDVFWWTLYAWNEIWTMGNPSGYTL